MMSALRRVAISLLHRYFLFKRGMTLGVRIACFDEAGRVFLVRHTYVPGWHLPGGGVELGETAEQAAAKEMREEGNLEVLGELRLVSIHLQNRVSKRDHVLFYCADVVQVGAKLPDREIAEAQFFALDELPSDITQSTRKRLCELAGEERADPYW